MESKSGIEQAYLACTVPTWGDPIHHAVDLVGDVLVTGSTSRFANLCEGGLPLADYGFQIFPWLRTCIAVIWLEAIPGSNLERLTSTILAYMCDLPGLDDSEVEQARAAESLRDAQQLEDPAERADLAASAVSLGLPIERCMALSTTAEPHHLLEALHLLRNADWFVLEYRAD